MSKRDINYKYLSLVLVTTLLGLVSLELIPEIGNAMDPTQSELFLRLLWFVGAVCYLLIFIMVIGPLYAIWGARNEQVHSVLDEITTDYYIAGNPQLGMGPPHPDGHGNRCDCWSCWSQIHGP